MFFDWVIGVLFRPGATFERSRQQLRLGYWWIVLTVITLEAVGSVFDPTFGDPTKWGTIAFSLVLQDLLLFDLQALLLMGVAWLLRWKLRWPEAVKYAGLLWSVALIEDICTFYPFLVGRTQLAMGISAVFTVWYIVAAVFGLRKVSGLTAWKSAAVALVATVPWRVGLFALSYWSLPK